MPHRLELAASFSDVSFAVSGPVCPQPVVGETCNAVGFWFIDFRNYREITSILIRESFRVNVRAENVVFFF